MGNNTLITEIEWTPELDQYKQSLETMYADKSVLPIFNDGKEKAAVLMSVLFDNASQYVYLYCNSLGSELTTVNIYQEALSKCVDRGVKFKVLIQSSEAKMDEGALAIIKKNEHNEVRRLNPGEVDRIQTQMNGLDVHFAVADEKMFRLEYDPKGYKATASFNDPNIACRLKSVFESVQEQA